MIGLLLEGFIKTQGTLELITEPAALFPSYGDQSFRVSEIAGKGGLADPKGRSYGSSSGSLYQVNLLETMHKEGRHPTATLGCGGFATLGRGPILGDVATAKTEDSLPGPGDRIVDFPEGKWSRTACQSPLPWGTVRPLH
nr:plasma membrane Na(+) /H(+) antiporter [Tanacetum cinerariifolium]